MFTNEELYDMIKGGNQTLVKGEKKIYGKIKEHDEASAARQRTVMKGQKKIYDKVHKEHEETRDLIRKYFGLEPLTSKQKGICFAVAIIFGILAFCLFLWGALEGVYLFKVVSYTTEVVDKTLQYSTETAPFWPAIWGLTFIYAVGAGIVSWILCGSSTRREEDDDDDDDEEEET